jgi:hypothetical protein
MSDHIKYVYIENYNNITFRVDTDDEWSFESKNADIFLNKLVKKMAEANIQTIPVEMPQVNHNHGCFETYEFKTYADSKSTIIDLEELEKEVDGFKKDLDNFLDDLTGRKK